MIDRLRWSCLLLGWVAALIGSGPRPLSAADVPARQEHVGQFVTLETPLSDTVIFNVRRTLEELKSQAIKGKKAYLVLEIRKGTSQFHHAYALADLLTSDATVGVTTVAWIPEPLAGVHGFVALACQEIVMRPEATLGDLGNGQALAADEQLIIRSIVDRRRNRKVSPEVATALMDPQQMLVQVTVERKAGEAEKLVTTTAEVDRLRGEGTVIKDPRTVKEAGEVKVFTGEEARSLDILAVQTASDRGAVANLYDLPLEALRERPVVKGDIQAAVIEVRDPIDAVNTAFIKRQIERAEAGQVQLIVFVLYGPGGYNYECLDLAQTLAGLKEDHVRTVAFIPRQASAGEAVIALGCDDIYLAPSAKIGEIGLAIDKLGPNDRENARRILEQGLESLAEAKGRPPALVRSMLDPETEVFQVTHKHKGTVDYQSEAEIARADGDWIKGPLVPETKRGSLLVVDGVRATELQLAQGTINDLDELRSHLGISADSVLRPMKKTWVDSVVFLLNRRDVTVLLCFMMMMSWYFEAVTGTGLFAIGSFLCMALFFWSRVLGGTADTLELMLFLIGVGLLLLEIFVIPGFGVFGVVGILLMLVSVIMASQTFVGALDPERDIMAATKTLTGLGGAVAAVVVTGLILSRFLPTIPILRDMVLVPPSAENATSQAPRLRPDLVDEHAALIGRTGRAVTMLRPAGKVEIDGRLIEVTSEGGFIAEGSEVEIVHASKQRIVVRSASLA